MKESYQYKNGKIHVTDFSDGEEHEFTYNYQDNIETILITENIIEKLNHLKEEINNEILANNKKIKTLNEFLRIGVGFAVLLYCIAIILCFLAPNIITALSPFVAISLVTGPLAYIFYKYNESKRIEEGKKIELKEIEKKIESNKKYLKKLKREKQKDNEKEMEEKVYCVKYEDKIKELKDYFKICYYIGYFKKQYQKHYNEGNIKENLEDIFSEDELRLIKKYISNNRT